MGNVASPGHTNFVEVLEKPTLSVPKTSPMKPNVVFDMTTWVVSSADGYGAVYYSEGW